MFETILHPNALNASDDLAFDHALALAVKSKSDLSILHVDETQSDAHEWDRFPAVRDRLVDWGQLAVGATQGDVEQQLGVSIRKIDAKYDNPVKATLGYLENRNADLIVLSNGGRHGMQRWLSPSVSEPIAREAGTPCLFVPESANGFVNPASGRIDLQRILIPVTLQPDYWPAMQMAQNLCDLLGIEEPRISCLHVGDQFPGLSRRITLQFDLKTASGRVADVICDEARESQIIIMTTEGHTGILDAITGSTTEQVIRQAPCPVLTVPVPGE